MKMGRGLIILGCTAIVAIGLAACGGGDDATSTATAKATATGQQTTAASKATGASTQPTSAATATQQANGGGGGNDPCTLLTQSEVEAALGVSVSAGELTSVGDSPVSAGVTANVASCAYSSTSTIDSLSVDVWSAPGKNDAIKQLTDFICSTKESVSGLGDVACWYSAEHGELQFSKGANYVDMHATSSSDTTDLLKSLGEKVLGRLP